MTSATRHPPPRSPSRRTPAVLSSSSTSSPSEFTKRVRNQEWLPQYFLLLHQLCCRRSLNSASTRPLGSPPGLVADWRNVSLSPSAPHSANFGSPLARLWRWPRGHRVPCFSDPLLQNWKIAGNVYLSLSIQEITCKETTRPASADTIIPAPSNTSWFRPRREGPYSVSEPLRFLPHKATRGGQDGRQVITGWTGNSAEKKIIQVR